MDVRTHFSTGLRRVFRAPSLVAWVYLTSLVVAFPLTLAMKDLLQASFEGSLVEDRLRQGFDPAWHEEFAARNTGLGKTFGPSLVGILPMLGNLERLLDGTLHQVDTMVLGAGMVMLLVWSLLLGGILSRFAHDGEQDSGSIFLAQGRLFFWRFLRLSLISVLLYGAILRGIGNPLHRWIETMTRDTTVERTALIYTVLAYALVGSLFLLTQLLLDYARICLVVEERRSVLLRCFERWVSSKTIDAPCWVFTFCCQPPPSFGFLPTPGLRLAPTNPPGRRSSWHSCWGRFIWRDGGFSSSGSWPVRPIFFFRPSRPLSRPRRDKTGQGKMLRP